MSKCGARALSPPVYDENTLTMATAIRHRAPLFCSLYWRKRHVKVLLRALGFRLNRFSLFLGFEHAAGDFGLEVMTEIFRENAGGDQFAQIGNRQFRQKREDSGQGSGRLAKQRDAHVVVVAPLGVLGDGLHHSWREFTACKHAENLRFGEIGIGEGSLDDRRLAVSEQSARDARR